MIREWAKELFPIIKAFASGANIQYRKKGYDKWQDINDDTNVAFNSSAEEYRIKPEPKYRPFNTAEECWNEARKHNDFPWIKHVDGEYTQIKNIGKYKVKVEHSDHVRSEYQFDMALNAFTFTDGKPFGIKEE